MHIPPLTLAVSYKIFTFSTTPTFVAGNVFSSWELLFPAIVRFVLIVSILLFVVLMLIGGLQYLFSAGNEEGTKQARKLLINATVGLVIVLSVQAIAIEALLQTNRRDLLQYVPIYSFGSQMGLTSSTGSSVKSSTGGAVKSTTGTGVESETGTGVESTVGTPVETTAGTDVQTEDGTGVLSLPGTSIQTGPGTSIKTGPGSGIITTNPANCTKSPASTYAQCN